MATNCALNNSAVMKTFYPTSKDGLDAITFLQAQETPIKNFLRKQLRKKKAIKWHITLQVKFVKTNSEGETLTASPYFRSKCVVTLHKSTIGKQIRQSFAAILSRFAEWLKEGSGWWLDEIIKLDIRAGKYQPLGGRGYFPLPPHLARKRALVNIRNTDEFCFVWCVLAGLHTVKVHPERISHYRNYFDSVKISGLTFPLRIAQVPTFERNNRLSINVYGYSEGVVYPLHISSFSSIKPTIHLLYLEANNQKHYCLIKSLSRLLRAQKGAGNKRYYCPRCLHGFSKESLLKNHEGLCAGQSPQRVAMPKPDNNSLQFVDFHKQDRLKFVIYCDFESLLVPLATCQPPPNSSHSNRTHLHVPCAFSYVVVSTFKELSKPPVVYRGPDAVDRFLSLLLKEEDEILDILYKYNPIIMTESDWDDFLNATNCHICGGPIGSEDLRVRDHMHIGLNSQGSNYRGLSHPMCNVKFKLSKRIPVVLHNLKNYDAHLIMEGIGKLGKDNIKCIPQNSERYISFSLGRHLTFIDSFQFLSSSLAKLVDNLSKEGAEKFTFLERYLPSIPTDLLIRKQVYPYKYMNSWDKFVETVLPPKDEFYSDITGEHITDSDYEHAKTMWKVCKFKHLGDMCDFYVATDTLLLAQVMERFRDLTMDNYGLDALHYVSLPGLTFDACLKYTKVKLELLTDIDKYLFFEQGVRGGISVISHRHAIANNPSVPNYDPSKENSYIALWDYNALYSTALTQPLPKGNFRWLEDEELYTFDLDQISEGSSEGYVLQVDLRYPPNLHDLHNLYPLAPEQMKITSKMHSPYLKSLLKKHGLNRMPSSSKLVTNLQDKKGYIVHYRTLQTYLKLGLEITAIHKILAFNEEPWARPYVELNTLKRKHAKTVFEQDMFKLMLNSFFGKCMENVRKRVNVNLVCTSQKFEKLLRKPTFKTFEIFNKHLVGVSMKKLKVLLNKPIYVGFSILDLSKKFMYEFHYLKVLKRYGSSARLLFTDTDSLCYHVTTEDIYKDMYENLDWFDTSNFPESHYLHSNMRKKELGVFKDEMGGDIVCEFVGLRPKLYSILTVSKNKKTAKGINKATINKHLRHEQYLSSLFDGVKHSHSMSGIRSDKHKLFNYTIKKTSLCPLDDKRYILNDGISSLAYGHYRIKPE